MISNRVSQSKSPKPMSSSSDSDSSFFTSSFLSSTETVKYDTFYYNNYKWQSRRIITALGCLLHSTSDWCVLEQDVSRQTFIINVWRKAPPSPHHSLSLVGGSCLTLMPSPTCTFHDWPFEGFCAEYNIWNKFLALRSTETLAPRISTPSVIVATLHSYLHPTDNEHQTVRIPDQMILLVNFKTKKPSYRWQVVLSIT